MNIGRGMRSANRRLPLSFALLLVGLLLILAACGNADPAETASTSGANEALSTADSNESVLNSSLPERDPDASETATADGNTVDYPSLDPSPEVNDEQETTPNPQVVEAHNRLGMLIFEKLLSQNAKMNDTVFISPTSIALALSMAYNGADGETEKAMAEAMQFSHLSRDKINASSLALLRALDGTNVSDSQSLGVLLDIANSIWYRREFALNEAFLHENEHFYNAKIEGLDFNAPESTHTINGWVSDATRGLIPSVVDRLDPDLVMMLINAVYFNGDWTKPFDQRATQNVPFHLASGETQDVPMMYQSGRIGYYKHDDFQAIRLPYGEDERLAMYVFLPASDMDIPEFAAGFTYETMTDSFDRFTPTQGEVTLPRMDIEYETKLNEALQSLGMGIAFNPGMADFSRMHPQDLEENLYIGDVVHQSVLKVDEEGTEAAAVTSIDVRVTSMPMYQFNFKADRPFMLAIRDDETQALLFVGSIMNPQP